jgi:hypothetical protein
MGSRDRIAAAASRITATHSSANETKPWRLRLIEFFGQRIQPIG